MTEQDVYIDCAAAHQRARDLRSEASDTRALAQSMQAQLGSLAPSWKGVSSSLFAQSAATRVSKLQKAADRLDELANAIDGTADAYQKAQISKIRATEAAKKGSSSGGHSSGGGKRG